MYGILKTRLTFLVLFIPYLSPIGKEPEGIQLIFPEKGVARILFIREGWIFFGVMWEHEGKNLGGENSEFPNFIFIYFWTTLIVNYYGVNVVIFAYWKYLRSWDKPLWNNCLGQRSTWKINILWPINDKTHGIRVSM